MKFNRILQEQKKEELDLSNPFHKRLLDWVKDYIKMKLYIIHSYGERPPKEMKVLKIKINKEIKRLNLNKNDVYFYYGDVENRREKKEVMRKIGMFE